jgi:hypothetical protein
VRHFLLDFRLRVRRGVCCQTDERAKRHQGWLQSSSVSSWNAGQGGYGIQTSPVLSRFAASLVLDTACQMALSGQVRLSNDTALKSLQDNID